MKLEVGKQYRMRKADASLKEKYENSGLGYPPEMALIAQDEPLVTIVNYDPGVGYQTKEFIFTWLAESFVSLDEQGLKLSLK